MQTLAIVREGSYDYFDRLTTTIKHSFGPYLPDPAGFGKIRNRNLDGCCRRQYSQFSPAKMHGERSPTGQGVSTRATAAKKKAPQPSQSAVIAAGKPGWLKQEVLVLSSLLLFATLALYLPVHSHPFLNFDDPVYVLGNPHISNLDGETVAWAFTTFYQFNWHPLTWLSHALDVQMFQLDPSGHHITNLLLQAANVLLLFWVLRRATGFVGRSAMVAGLFALHPMNVESVAWISERKNLLSMFFFLLGMAAYRWYADSDAPPRSTGRSPQRATDNATGPSVGRYAVMTLCFVLGLMSKPQIITFPFILLLWDYWPLERMAFAGETAMSGLPARNFWWLVKEKIPLFAICAASAVVTVAAQKAGGAVASLQHYALSVRITNAIVSYARYIGKTVWPMRMAPMYPHPWHSLPTWQVLSSLLVLAAITALVLAARSRRYLLVGWLWFLGSLVPMIGLVHVGSQAMADRYAYLPFIGIFIMACWGVADLAARQHMPDAALRVLSIMVLLALAIVTHRQLGYWSDNATLWRHTLEVTQENYVAHDNLALLLMKQGQPDEAVKHYRAALAIYPSDPFSNLRLAEYDHEHGNLQEAIARYDAMISFTPSGPALAGLYGNQSLVYLDMHDYPHAEEAAMRAVQIDRNNSRAWLGLGFVADRSGDVNQAIKDYQHSIAIRPQKITYLLLAKALDKTGRTTEAQSARERAQLATDENQLMKYSDPFLGS